MQEELMQFKLQQVWTLMDLPHGKRAIGTKWVYRNKKDERGIVIRNKARLVAQGYTQEEGSDYDEVFALVARIEAITASSCCGQNPVFHSKIKHIEIRHHFIRDSYKKRLIQVIKIHIDYNVADLLTKAFDVSIFQYLIASIGMLKPWSIGLRGSMSHEVLQGYIGVTLWESSLKDLIQSCLLHHLRLPTHLSTHSEPGRVFWGADEELSDGGLRHSTSLPALCAGPEAPTPSPVEGYVADSDPVEDLEEDPEKDHDEEPFEYEDDDEEEEEEQLAPTDSSVVSVVDLLPSTGDTEAFETDESAPTPRSPHIRIPFAQTRLRKARMLPHLHHHQPPPSPYHLLSPPLSQITLPPLPPPPSSLHLPPPIPTSLPLPSSPLPVSLFIPPPVDRREDISKAELPPCKRLCSTAPTSRYGVGESLVGEFDAALDLLGSRCGLWVLSGIKNGCRDETSESS
ncbi:putative ribonuclease H-like domain-containing protein [Tanacetum coccineum]